MARAAAVLALTLLLASPSEAAVQEPGPGRNCRLVLEPATDSTRSLSIEVEPDRYVTYVGGGLRWTCGDARAYADSAVKYDVQRRLKMIGSVDYEDPLRTLTADTVTYFEVQDRILARGHAVVVRKSSGARIAGPSVEFYRSSSGEVRRTVATDRPRLRVFTDTVARDTANPVLVDADRIELLPGDEAMAWGDVVIQRPDLDARADSAHFDMRAGSGILYGAPRVEGRGVSLTGRTIRTSFSDGELQEVFAETEATAVGEGFRLLSERIRGKLAQREIERLWASGESPSVALTSANRLAADSLAFAFRAGRIDTLYAVGDAQAVERAGEAGDERRERVGLGADERSWVAGDTLVMAFVPDSADGRADTAGAAGGGIGDSAGTAGDARLRSVLARGDARAYRILRPEEGTGEPGRHYQRGSEILVRFRDGAAYRVEGDRAIGVHLDPLPPGARADTVPQGAPGAQPDSLLEEAPGAAGDSLSEGGPPAAGDSTRGSGGR